MVHRPSDPRLLLNLISHDKNYSKHLQSLLDSSHASLTSLSAFAATSAEPVSGVILSIVEDFSNADDALCRYKDAVDAWREQLLSLKNLETEIASIARDREILVTRVLKASKHEKPPKDKDRTTALSKRTSIISHPTRFASESSLSLSIGHSSYSPSSLQTSSKLENAQAELRACETHLTVKEAELEVARIIAIRDGLRIRCDALIDCGQAWVDMGRSGIRILADLQIDRRDTQNLRQCQSPVPAPHSNSPPLTPTPTPHHTRNGSGSTDASHHQISEISTIGPSQSASQVNAYVDQNPIADPFIIPNAPNPILGANGSDVLGHRVSVHSIIRPNSTPPTTVSFRNVDLPQLPRNHSMIDVTYVNKPAPGFEFEESRIRVPAAHAIQDGLVPTLTPNAQPKTVQPSSGYLTPVSNDGTDDCRKEEKVKEQVVESPKPERHALPISQVEERPEPAVVGGYAPRIVSGAAEVRQSPLADDLRRPTAPPPASAPAEEPQSHQHRNYSESSSIKKSGFLSSLKRVFGGTGTSRHYGEERAREKEVKAWEREGKKMEKEDRRNEKKEQKMEKARLRGVSREGRQREMEGRKGQREKEKLGEEERKWKPSTREAKILRADSSTDDERSIEDQETKRAARRVNLIGKGKREQKLTPDEDEDHVLPRDSEEVERAQGGYIVKQNVDLQKNLRGGVISSGHVAPFDMFTGGSKVSSDSRRRSTTAGGMGDKSHLEGRATGGSFVFERGAKVNKGSSAHHPANVSASTEPFPAPPIRPPGTHSNLRSDTKFWENISNRSGSPIQVPPTISERGESSVTRAVTGLGVGGIKRGSSGQRQITVSQPYHGNGVRGSRDRDITAPAAMSTPPKRQMMNGHTRRAVSVDHGRSISVSSLPPQIRMPAPTTRQHAVPPNVEPGESLMSIVDGLARSNRRAWGMGLMEVSRSRENMRSGVGVEQRSGGAGGGRTVKGKVNEGAVISGNKGNSLGRLDTTVYDKTPRRDGEVSAKTWSSLPAESVSGGSAHPAPVIKRAGQEEGEDDSASTSSYETGKEDLQIEEETQNRPADARLLAPTSVSQKPEEIDRRTISPPPAIRFKAPDRADGASPASTPPRRKSVRVSLNPTFSPTPPVIEDEVDQYMRAPFVFKEQVVAPPSVLGTRNQSRTQASSLQPAHASGARSRDLWDDDDEANTAYEEAKKSFMMAARKERDVMW